ncbi:hypothetical protein B0T16DRAFT_170552 [Cercophora newfieldiana]|uniref:Uncharacterized protein n=1 Tax=Cercophora newfieldiana TaxID=92897 RepID=A0AA39Y6A8_9PEZI|nr:hypothetical protein B0T16DRAFT_170552 [Cercophora newfieldiana]
MSPPMSSTASSTTPSPTASPPTSTLASSPTSSPASLLPPTPPHRPEVECLHHIKRWLRNRRDSTAEADSNPAPEPFGKYSVCWRELDILGISPTEAKEGAEREVPLPAVGLPCTHLLCRACHRTICDECEWLCPCCRVDFAATRCGHSAAEVVPGAGDEETSWAPTPGYAADSECGGWVRPEYCWDCLSRRGDSEAVDEEAMDEDTGLNEDVALAVEYDWTDEEMQDIDQWIDSRLDNAGLAQRVPQGVDPG